MVETMQNGKSKCTVIFDERAPAGMPVLTTIVDSKGKDAAYWAEVMPSDFGIAVSFRRIGAFIPDDERQYNVLLPDEPEVSATCECKGYLRHLHCKHVAAAMKLHFCGLLKKSPRPEHAEEIPAKAEKSEECCAFCLRHECEC
jgi:hypothetical protein